MNATDRACRLRRRAALSAAALAGTVLATRMLAPRRRQVAEVAPELRSPILYLPLALRNSFTLRVGRLLTRRATPVRPGVEVVRRAVDDGDGTTTAVLVYEPSTRARPSGGLLWIHGGGTVLGRPEMSHHVCSTFAAELGIVVVSVDYRLAPEHPFPAGLEDCYGALAWLHAEADALGVDAGRVAVGGDSAGGGLAAALCQMARDRGGPPVVFQVLVYPMLDDRTVLRDGAGPGLVWTATSNRYAWTAYLGHHPTIDDERPYAAAARRADLTGLPPAWIGVGDIDLFHEEDVEYARRLEAAGVPCELHVEPRMYHGADSVLPDASTSRAFRARMTAALGDALAAAPRAGT